MAISSIPPTRAQSSSLAIRTCEFGKWVKHAEPGQSIEYHRGYLVIDRANGFSRLGEKARRELHAIAGHVVFLADEGRLVLAQRRLDEGEFSYLAIKTKQPA